MGFEPSGGRSTATTEVIAALANGDLSAFTYTNNGQSSGLRTAPERR